MRAYDEEAPSIAIMEALAAIRDQNVTDLEPLTEAAVDGEALDELFQPTPVRLLTKGHSYPL